LRVRISHGFSEGLATVRSIRRERLISASFSLDKIHDELWDFRSPNEDEARGVFDSFFSDSEGDFYNEIGDAFKKDNHHGELCQDACPLYASDLGFTECFKIFFGGAISSF
jgi:hypothetical protein